jgi:hypothetical protein
MAKLVLARTRADTSKWNRLYNMNSSEDKDLGIKGWLSGKGPKAKPQESKTGQLFSINIGLPCCPLST